MFINYRFQQGLIRTAALLKKLDIPISQLDFWKTEWRKKGNDCYDMGLRLIGNKKSAKGGIALWDPIQFLNWIALNKLKNKPKNTMEKIDQDKLLVFAKKHIEIKNED